MLELEVKAVVADVDALRAALDRAGAVCAWRGMMRDRRFDHDDRFGARDEVVRVRAYEGDGPLSTVLGWKGRTVRTPDGLKAREEIELHSPDDAGHAMRLMDALGFAVVHAIDRRIERWELGGATLRIEWYPQMDVLLEVEGSASAIDAAIRATTLPRAAFSTDSLATFVARYRERTGRTAAVSEAELDGRTPPGWGP